jgi:hypothetical protein
MALLSVATAAIPVAAGVSEPGSDDAVARQLREEILAKGLSFEVAPSPVTELELDEICGLRIPQRWWQTAQTLEQGSPELALPSSFDWRDYGVVTPVKNQGACGAGWAFVTVAALESRILIDNGPVTDLSEQYLVSCNDDGWGCNGGWFAHDYHVKDGAVYESCRPYTASDDPCLCECSHPYKAAAWYYVSGSSSVPSTDAIKNAIYSHGPVVCAVYADSAFQYYSGGIFDGTASGQANLAVLLVGWDDPGGYWILKNCWGTGWGESGYMRIAYGSQQIGYAANYLGGSVSGSWPADDDCGGGCTATMTTSDEALSALNALVQECRPGSRIALVDRITREHQLEISRIMARSAPVRHLVQRGLWTNLLAVQKLSGGQQGIRLDTTDLLMAVELARASASPSLARDLNLLEEALHQLNGEPSAELQR